VGFFRGGYFFLVGDSASGKTWLSRTCFAEAVLKKSFKDYRLIFDDTEGGALMDNEFFFGKEVARRIEPPKRDKRGEPVNSDTVEDFYFNITDAIKAGRPFIYVLDSQDGLGSDSSEEKFEKQKKAASQGGDAAGSYGDGKAKYHSEHIRMVISKIRKMGSILIIIGQTRDNLGMGFEKKIRSGGKALRFYANMEIWTSVKEKIKKLVRGKERTVGSYVLAEVKKNRVSGKIGKDRAAVIPILYDYGIDDVGSCVDYLIDEKHWKTTKSDGEEEGKKKIYDCPEIMFKGSRNRIVRYVEDEGLEKKLRDTVAKVWREIDEECSTGRARRYE